MKTMNLKKAASVMVLASVATVMSAQTPEKLFNDELAGGELQSKDIYRWNETSQSWKLSRSYDYAAEGIRFTDYER